MKEKTKLFFIFKKLNQIGDNIVKVLSKLFSRILYLIGCLTVCIFSIVSLFPEGRDSTCADDGGVWDNEYQECRFDCEHWNERDGCILRSDEELTNYVNGYCSGDGKGLYRCKQAKLELSKRILRDKMNNNKSK